jgi:2-hydroxy-6-oxonona-2,4-dienedioate hydrolase
VTAGITRRQLLAGLVLSAAVAACAAGWSFRAALARSRERLRGQSRVIATRWGALEYAEAGQGTPLLMIHGTGGGFDQGLLFARRLAQQGQRIIAPSRFGYLRSSFPPDPSPANQADAFAALLDHLGIEKVAVAGGSAGALSAAQFALRHPDRCAALILLVPAANVQGCDPVEMTAIQHFVFNNLLGSDFLYWALLRLAPDWLTATLLATDPKLVARAAPDERNRAQQILETMLPISARTMGMVNDGKLAGNPAPIDFAAIRVPTLILSAQDDRFGTAATARTLATAIPGARLVIYPHGGHIWVGHDAEVANRIAAHIAVSSSLMATKAKATELSATP